MPVGRKKGQPGEDGIEENAAGHRRLAARRDRQVSEPDSAHGPAEQEGREKEPEFRRCRVGARQIANQVVLGQVIDLPLERVEDPTRRRDDQDEPLISGDVGVPGPSVGGEEVGLKGLAHR